jgi:hypothetical protein
MASTLNGTGVTFSDGTTQNSASTFGAIGTYAILFRTSTVNGFANQTVSGSYLFYVSSQPAGNVPSITGPTYVSGDRRNATSGFTTTNNSANSITMANLAGTWRYVSTSPGSAYDGCMGFTFLNGTILVRVS